MKLTFSLFSIAMCAVLGTAPAQAQQIVLGDNGARACYLKVKHGDQGRHTTIRDCRRALSDELLNKNDMTATHVNVGILLMRSGKLDLAQLQFKKALSVNSDLPEVYINQSAAFIYSGDFAAAEQAASRAIELKTKKLPEAYYNRAMAHERRQDWDAAYKDLRRALKAKPNWKLAEDALANYTLEPAPVN